MGNVIKLHPSIRENLKPLLSAASLAEYLIMKPDQQETVLHNSRFSSPPPVSAYQQAMLPIKNYLADLTRTKSTLSDAKDRLTIKSNDQSIRPKMREEATRCIETLEMFDRAENSFGLSPMKFSLFPKQERININGVMLSVQPDLMSEKSTKNGRVAGGIFFRPQKAPDPNSCIRAETKQRKEDHRREMARYMLAMMQILFEQPDSNLPTFSREISFLADIRISERIEFSTKDHAARVKSISAACKQISSLWDDIEPRRSVLRQ